MLNNQEKEICLPCVGFEKNYAVSSKGIIYSFPRNGTSKHTREMKTSLNKYGYERISMHKDDKAYYKTIHRLVAEAFLPNPYNKPQVNHIDGIKTNNNVSNLEWATAKENKAHAVLNNLSSDIGKFNSDTKRKLNSTQLIEVKKLLQDKSMMQKDIAIKYGVSKQVITLIKQGATYNER